ncbi:hypothetical protein U1Q18_005547 [Sarracenia purpurea var. burkii]
MFLRKLGSENVSEASAIIFNKVELYETTFGMELKEALHHNKMMNKELGDKRTENVVQINLWVAHLGTKEQEIDSVNSDNFSQNHVFFNSSPFFHCPIWLCTLSQGWFFVFVVTNKKRIKMVSIDFVVKDARRNF